MPRLDIALKNTPLEEARNLGRVLGGPRIFVKRDDLTGVALGGNKLRNLEFRLAHAMKDEPDTVIVGLDLQSNSARQTAGACNKLGLRTILVLEGTKPDDVQGNLLIDYLLGADVPQMVTILINQPDADAAGAGETSVTVTVAAIANAIFDATGARVRQVPMTPERVKRALEGRG